MFGRWGGSVSVRWVGMWEGGSIDSCCSGVAAMFHLKIPSLNLSRFLTPSRHPHTHTHRVVIPMLDRPDHYRL